MENYFLLENYITSEGAVSHNVLYYQPLPILGFMRVTTNSVPCLYARKIIWRHPDVSSNVICIAS